MCERVMITVLTAVFLLLMAASSFAEADYETYFNLLSEEASANLKTLPASKAKVYGRMFAENKDVLMAFILAKEESSKLMLAEPQHVLEHYQAVKELWQELQDVYSIPFFLSYIAKITVTEERITPYRELFRRNGLYELPVNYPDLYELVREVNLWTRRFMTFQQTSGRDMAPVDIMEKTNIGRCEEMMIFFISAARSLGIPARPAATSYWAHTDNNHAWVEVFVEDKWYHLGAVEPSYHLDDAWFSANAAKAIMITATAAFPDSTDIVVGTRGYISVINSTPHYDSEEVKARTVNVVTRDSNGNIIPECRVTLQVFNWGRLRPILQNRTDKEGKLSIVAGNGSFFVSAHHDSLYALAVIPNDRDGYLQELILQPLDRLASLYAKLEYRDKPLTKKPVSEDWTERTDAVAEEYNRIVGGYSGKAFSAKDSLQVKVLQAARNNRENVSRFFDEKKPESAFNAYLLKLDPKFLWQANAKQIGDLYDTYLRVKELGFPEDAMITLLSPTVFFEEIPQQKLPNSLTKWRKGKNRLQQLLTHLEKRYKLDEDKAVQSFQMPADMLADLEVLTSYQYKILACAVLNANNIPTRYTRLADVVQIYRDNGWRYYDIRKKDYFTPDKQAADKHKLLVTVLDEYDYPVVLDSRQTVLTFLREGQFFAAEATVSIADRGLLEAAVEAGNYQLQIGYRPNNNETHFYLESFSVTNNNIERVVRLKDYPREWDSVPDNIKDLLSLLDAGNPELKGYRFIVFGNHDREMVRRVAEELPRQSDRADYLWIGASMSPDTPQYYRVSEIYRDWLAQNPPYRERILTIHRVDDDNLRYFDGVWERLPDISGN